MNSRTISIAIATLVMFNALMSGTNITVRGEYRLVETRLNTASTLAQQEEFNISSYYDFSVASMDIIVSRLINLTTGVVFHSSDADWELFELTSSLSNYHWTIRALAQAYETTNNITYSIAMSRAALKMVELFYDPVYPGFYVNAYSDPEVATTKRAGVQAYAYWALDRAETVNASLDFSVQKESAIHCLADMLNDPIYGGFFFFTMRNGSLSIPEYIWEVYPNNGKRLDHLALGATALFDAGVATGNTTLINIAQQALEFLSIQMRYYYDMEFVGLRLAVLRNGGTLVLDEGLRPGHTVVTDLNAIAIRALLKGYETTGDSSYLDLARDVFEALLANNWDQTSGGWFAEVLNGVPYDPNNDEDVKFYKYSEIQFQMILALEELYETTLDQFPLRLIIDTLELVLAKLWEPVDEGFVSNGNQDWDVIDPNWEIHYTAVQSQAVLVLERVWSYGLPFVSNVRIQPTNPRPQDLINFIATAHDEDGISLVYVNYTMNINGSETNGVLVLEPNPFAGGVFNSSMSNLPDQTSCNFIVVANDTTGREYVAGSYYFLVREDIYAPSVNLRAIYPTDEVRVGDDVIIDFNVVEFPSHSFVYDCQIWWRVNSGSFEIQNMTFMGVDQDNMVFRYNLGQFHRNDVVEFEGQCLDESGNLGISSRFKLTILGPKFVFTPTTLWQISLTIGLVAAPGIGYLYLRTRKRGYSEAQREGKKAAKRRARRRGPRGRR
ncbi:MAG: hypothetical protein ACFFE2_00565 [Candidatus Thorarchaeota archaeon]